MPSDDAADHLLAGNPAGFGEVLTCGALRSLFVAPGLYLAGIRGKKLIWGSLTASAMISVFSLVYSAARR